MKVSYWKWNRRRRGSVEGGCCGVRKGPGVLWVVGTRPGRLEGFGRGAENVNLHVGAALISFRLGNGCSDSESRSSSPSVSTTGVSPDIEESWFGKCTCESRDGIAGVVEGISGSGVDSFIGGDGGSNIRSNARGLKKSFTKPFLPYPGVLGSIGATGISWRMRKVPAILGASECEVSSSESPLGFSAASFDWVNDTSEALCITLAEGCSSSS